MMPTSLDEITKQGLKKAEALFGALEEEECITGEEVDRRVRVPAACKARAD
jgi:hypothetical protein